MPKNKTKLFQINSLNKAFGSQRVLKNLSLSIKPGEFTLLLGANGSGKSTLMRICVGLSRPDSGEIVFPGEVSKCSIYTKIGHTGHALFLYKNLSVKENIALFCNVCGNPRNVESYLKEWHLYKERDKTISELSRGLQSRVSLCRSFIHSPSFLFLDEPTSCLDESSIDLMLGKISQCLGQASKYGFALVATHDVKRLQEHADRILVLKNGVIAHDLLEMKASNPELSIKELKRRIINYYVESNR